MEEIAYLLKLNGPKVGLDIMMKSYVLPRIGETISITKFTDYEGRILTDHEMPEIFFERFYLVSTVYHNSHFRDERTEKQKSANLRDWCGDMTGVSFPEVWAGMVEDD